LAHGSGTFSFRGSSYRYLFHPYNGSWKNERVVEMPILFEFIEGIPDTEILEVGNVSWHYRRSRRHEVVDKYEVGSGVRNTDVVDLVGPARYRRIVSISTLEHVGYDESPKDPGKIARSVKALSGLLVPGGEALITIPIGYNPLLDADLRAGAHDFDEVAFLRKDETGWRWREASGEECWGAPYRDYMAYALAVCYIRKPAASDS
jgi:hypothetical protein